MSVDFGGCNHNVMESHGEFGEFPSRVRLHEVDEQDWEDPRQLNMCNSNARALLGLLGFDMGDGFGEVTVPEMRRAIVKARATFDRQAPNFTRETRTVMGRRPSTENGKVVELQPRMVDIGIDEQYLKEKLDKLSVLVEALAEKGATHIVWT